VQGNDRVQDTVAGLLDTSGARRHAVRPGCRFHVNGR
jgi:hypothetical protein